MQGYALAPFLTEKDDVESGEGAIDPLGTEPLADRLASKLVPGVRERQQHPRFLTCYASEAQPRFSLKLPPRTCPTEKAFCSMLQRLCVAPSLRAVAMSKRFSAASC